MTVGIVFNSSGKSIVAAGVLLEVFDDAIPIHVTDLEKKKDEVDELIFTFPRDMPPLDVYKKYGGREIDMYKAMLMYEEKHGEMVKFEEDDITGFINELELATRVYSNDRFYFPLEVVKAAIKTGLPAVYLNPRGIFREFHMRCRKVRTERQRAARSIEFLCKDDTIFAEVEFENYIDDLVAESTAKRYKKSRVIIISSRGALIYDRYGIKRISPEEARKIFEELPGPVEKIVPKKRR